MTTLKIGDTVRLAGSWHRHQVGHAPEGGCHFFQGPFDPVPFPFIFTLASVTARDPGARTDFSKDIIVRAGESVEIAGYGTYEVMTDRRGRGEWLVLV